MKNIERKVRSDYLNRIADDQCPCVDCDGDLDTGWECNDCGFDAFYLRNDASANFADKNTFIDLAAITAGET